MKYIFFVLFPILSYSQSNNDICEDITKSKNDLDNRILYEAPKGDVIEISKAIKGSKSYYILHLNSIDKQPSSVGNNGVVLQLNNGEKIKYYNVEINEVDDNYITTINLTESEMIKISKANISSFKIYKAPFVTETLIDLKEQEKNRKYFNCLLVIK